MSPWNPGPLPSSPIKAEPQPPALSTLGLAMWPQVSCVFSRSCDKPHLQGHLMVISEGPLVIKNPRAGPTTTLVPDRLKPAQNKYVWWCWCQQPWAASLGKSSPYSCSSRAVPPGFVLSALWCLHSNKYQMMHFSRHKPLVKWCMTGICNYSL